MWDTGYTQRTQYTLTKEYTLNYRGLIIFVIEGIFLNQGVLGSLGRGLETRYSGVVTWTSSALLQELGMSGYVTNLVRTARAEPQYWL